jgi:predicted alpha/beta hydrolase family esterase
MRSLLFVHGTGVRAERCEDFTATLRKGLSRTKPKPDVNVLSCYWGGLGASFRDDKSSVPVHGRGKRAAARPEPADDELARWMLLYQDPYAEFDALPAPAPATGADRSRQRVRDWQQAQAKLANLADCEPIRSALADWFDGDPEPLNLLSRAAYAVAHSPNVTRVLRPADPIGTEQARLAARAIVATFIRHIDAGSPPHSGAGDDEGTDGLDIPAPATVSGEERDELVKLIVAWLDVQDLGVIGAVIKSLIWPASLAASPWLRYRRAQVTDGVGPVAGDIVLYQARGEEIREKLRAAILDCPGEVVVLGHSLGGIIAADLLVESKEAADRVPLLLTAGSQVPFLYEINALKSLPFGEHLPQHFPRRWINFWDPDDLLSYIAHAVFAERGGQADGRVVEDVRIDGLQPFHWSHSAYFQRRDFLRRVAAELAALPAEEGR